MINLAVLVSGSGTTLQYIINQIKKGKLAASVAVVISSDKEAFALTRAKRYNIPAFYFHRKDFKKNFATDEELERFNDAMLEVLSKFEIDIIVLAGFMSKLTTKFINIYKNKIMNTHPALIPAFCGQGFYGNKVHKAVIDYGVKFSGCTIHFVDEEYDHGQIILQKIVPVYDNDTLESLGKRVRRAEKKLYCKAIQLFADRKLKIDGRKVMQLK